MEELLKQVATQGVLGILLALSLFVNYAMFKIIQNLNEKRISDAKEVTKTILEPLDTIKKNGENLIIMFSQFLNNTPKTRRGR